MKTVQTSEDKYRCFMTVKEFNKLCQKAKDKYGDDEFWVVIAIKILALSVRVGTLERINPTDFRKGERGVHLLRVYEKNSRGNTEQRLPRDIWIPKPIYNKIQKYVDENNIDEERRLIARSESTFRRRFDSIVEDLADETSNDDWLKVTPHDLRRYFAIHFLFRHRIDPTLVRQLGGWLSQESMLEYLIMPDDVLVDEIEDGGIRGTDATIHVNSAAEIESIVESFHSLIAQLNSDARTEAVRSLEEYLNNINGIVVDVKIDSEILKNIRDPSKSDQQVLEEYSGLPINKIAITFAESVEEKYNIDLKDAPINSHPHQMDTNLRKKIESAIQNKIKQFEKHPEYIDINSVNGRKNVLYMSSFIITATVAFSIFLPYNLLQMSLIACLGIVAAIININHDLNKHTSQTTVSIS